MELVRVQRGHLAMGASCPLQRDHSHVVHELEDGTRGGALDRCRAVRQRVPPCRAALALANGMDSTTSQRSGNPCTSPAAVFQR